MRLLALDTAAEQCSVALWLDGAVTAQAALAPPTHAERILPMVQAVLAEAAVALTSLDAVAFGRGPGAFTGVRLAASVAQGLAFAAGLPGIGLSNLAALAQQALASAGAPEFMLVCQDARMAEVYWAVYRRAGGAAPAEAARPGVALVGSERVGPAAAVTAPDGAWGVGSGFAAYPELRTRLAATLPVIDTERRVHARDIAQLAAWGGLAAAGPPETALPVYLRDDVATPRATAAHQGPPSQG